MRVESYTYERKAEWDEFVDEARQQTFLLKRGYMDYHADRFVDCSLMFYNDKKLCALFPANYDKESSTVQSHGGLTYGGMLTSTAVTQTEVLEIFQLMCEYYQTKLHAETILYKTIPYIYCVQPADEDLYALFRVGAVLDRRLVSTAVNLENPLKMRYLRQRGVKKALNAGMTLEYIVETNRQEYEEFWNILDSVLIGDHGTKPVHTVAEMRLLASRFPREIMLVVVKNSSGQVVAGTWLFNTTRVTHTQYIAANDEGKHCGALDLLFSQLISEAAKDRKYFDFGNSNEDAGRVLNEGLIFQKEGFGGRAVCYDQYKITIQR